MAAVSHSAFWVNHLDIAPNYGGVLLGITNTFASIPGFVGNSVTGWLLQTTNNNWSAVFMCIAGINVFGAVVFLIFAKGEKIIEPTEDNEEEQPIK